MRLFAIRLETDETVLMTANSPEEALENVGLPACLLLKSERVTPAPADAPERGYKLIEFDQLHLSFLFTGGGNLNLHDVGAATYEWLCELHPKVRLPAMK